MVIQMNESGLATIEQIREFLGGTADVGFSVPSEPAQLRAFVGMVLSRFKYAGRSKADRGVLFAYMRQLSGFSHSHLARLIAQHQHSGSVRLGSKARRTSYACKFTIADIAALADIDGLHDTPSGPATRVCRRRSNNPHLAD